MERVDQSVGQPLETLLESVRWIGQDAATSLSFHRLALPLIGILRSFNHTIRLRTISSRIEQRICSVVYRM